MGRSRTFDKAFARRFGIDLRSALGREDLTVTDAARIFGVTRQALHNYLTGKRIPRGEILARLVAFLNLPLRKGDHLFTAASFLLPSSPVDRPEEPQQKSFNFEGRQFDVNVSTRDNRSEFVQVALRK